MESHILTSSSTLSPEVLQKIATSGVFNEISNYPGAVRHHIYHHSKRDSTTNRLWHPMLFVMYQTSRHGPQNGFRLCLVHTGFEIAKPVKEEGEARDEIDELEREVPQGHIEVVILGERPTLSTTSEESE